MEYTIKLKITNGFKKFFEFIIDFIIMIQDNYFNNILLENDN